MSRFDYLIDRVAETPFADDPFRHLYIGNFLAEADFFEITTAPEINLAPANDDEDLFHKLFDAGYKVVSFPGCITERRAYIDWHAGQSVKQRPHTACEGFGITLRLYEPTTPAIRELNEFLLSEKWNRALADKFGVDYDGCVSDNGIQKYLDGYEISPHPDIRRKALTFMVNINPHANAEQLEHHTHYLRFKAERQHIPEYWKENLDVERCWVPWDWCETVKTQPENNSIVIFSPSFDTMHAVRARYDHLAAQRTQLYGNLWYPVDRTLNEVEWEDLDGRARRPNRLKALRKTLVNSLPPVARQALVDARQRLRSQDVVVRDF